MVNLIYTTQKSAVDTVEVKFKILIMCERRLNISVKSRKTTSPNPPVCVDKTAVGTGQTWTSIADKTGNITASEHRPTPDISYYTADSGQAFFHILSLHEYIIVDNLKRESKNRSSLDKTTNKRGQFISCFTIKFVIANSNLD